MALEASDAATAYFSKKLTGLIYEIIDGDREVPFQATVERMCVNAFWVMSECQSPIEEMLGAGLLFASDGYNSLKYVFTANLESPDQTFSDYYPEFGTIFTQQLAVGEYKADFAAVSCFKGRSLTTVIECDGHDYHERTKEQASRDKKRDRFFASQDITVLRFTGSEIYRDTDRCVKEIEGVLFNKIESLLVAAGAVEAAPRKSIA